MTVTTIESSLSASPPRDRESHDTTREGDR